MNTDNRNILHKESIDFGPDISLAKSNETFSESVNNSLISPTTLSNISTNLNYALTSNPQPILLDQSMKLHTNQPPFQDSNYSTIYSQYINQTSASSNYSPSEVSYRMTDFDLTEANPYTKYKSLEQYRAAAKSTQDPSFKFNYIKFLLSTAENITKNAPDTKRAKKSKLLLETEALKALKQLAIESSGIGKLGYPDAQFMLAEWHGSGLFGLNIDHEKSFALYQQAAKQNHPAANYRVAVCFEIGAGVKKDSSKAIQYYRKASGLGDTSAMHKLAMLLIHGGLGITKNAREGITLLKRAVSESDESTPNALYELALLYEGCHSEEVAHMLIPDLSYAFELLSRAAVLGHATSQYRLGMSFEHGLLNLPLDARRSIAWYTKAAAQGDPDAELALSGWYLTGAEGILSQSDSDAYLWARKAADKGLSKAEFAVGYFTENGIGVRIDVGEARKWYLRAATQGNKKSIQRLKELKAISIQQSAEATKYRETIMTKKEPKNCIIL